MVERVGAPLRRVLIADDDEGIRSLLRETLEGAGYQTVATESGDEAVDAAQRERPSAAVLDINMPGHSGYEVCAAIRRLYGASVAIIFVSGERVESFDRVAGFLVGADDYLVKPFAPDELLERLRAALRHVDSNGYTVPALTPREQEVLQLLALGLTQAEIAEQLSISPKTVGTHIERILSKLGVRSRAQAVAAAYRGHLVAQA